MCEQQEKHEIRECIWCGKSHTPIYKNKWFCGDSNCYVEFHRTRTKYYPWLSPLEFKRLILDWLSQDVPNHPNPKHEISRINQRVAEIWRNATEVINIFNKHLSAEDEKQ